MPIFELPGGIDLDGNGTVDAAKIDHVAKAKSRLPVQYQNKTVRPNIDALVEILTSPAQELEDVFWTLVYERTIAKAVELGLDSVLDLIGKLVGEPRGGKSNADYARFINARIKTRRSNGLIEEIIAIARLVVYDANARVHLEQAGIATLTVTIEDAPIADATAAILITFLKAAVSAGVHVYVEWSSVDPADGWFTWDSDENLEQWDDGSFIEGDDGL